MRHPQSTSASAVQKPGSNPTVSEPEAASRSTPPSRSRFAALRLLLPYFRPYRLLLVGWLGFLAVSSLATLSLPVAVRVMIDRGFAHADPATLKR